MMLDLDYSLIALIFGLTVAIHYIISFDRIAWLAETEVNFFTNFALKYSPGRFAEWLGAGLQNQLQRFESATDLNIKTELSDNKEVRFFVLPLLAYFLKTF